MAAVSDENKGKVEALIFEINRRTDEKVAAGKIEVRIEKDAEIQDLKRQLAEATSGDTEQARKDGENSVIEAIKSGLGLGDF